MRVPLVEVQAEEQVEEALYSLAAAEPLPVNSKAPPRPLGARSRALPAEGRLLLLFLLRWWRRRMVIVLRLPRVDSTTTTTSAVWTLVVMRPQVHNWQPIDELAGWLADFRRRLGQRRA